MDDLRAALHHAADLVADYRAGVGDARVTPDRDRRSVADTLRAPLPEDPAGLGAIVDELVAAAEPGLMATAGPRYFGFVIGGSLRRRAARRHAHQRAGTRTGSTRRSRPPPLAVEEVAGAWLKELLRHPRVGVGRLRDRRPGRQHGGARGGAQRVLQQHGWDVGRDGLHGAPPVRVVAERGAARDDRPLAAAARPRRRRRSSRCRPTPTARWTRPHLVRGRWRSSPAGPTIVCLQAGNVNTGAVRRPAAIGDAGAGAHEAWVHVDGAFGLWAAASPRTRHLVDGIELADSWGCDGHKWLNVPYDSGFAFCAHPDVHAAALVVHGGVPDRPGAGRDSAAATSCPSRPGAPAASRSGPRSARSAADGVAELVDRCCALARDFADGSPPSTASRSRTTSS